MGEQIQDSQHGHEPQVDLSENFVGLLITHIGQKHFFFWRQPERKPSLEMLGSFLERYELDWRLSLHTANICLVDNIEMA